jgi:hypothetical protein
LARRVSLPAADDLFRPTAPPETPEPTERAQPEEQPTGDSSQTDTSSVQQTGDADAAEEKQESHGRTGTTRRPSGRVRHDEKMTVYVTSDELLDLEHARLLLRREHGLAVDRGRLVREAVALALADLDARGEESVIVQRLKQV